MMMKRLTARTSNGVAYLVSVKDTEQEVTSPYENTLKCILQAFNTLAAYEDLGTMENLKEQKRKLDCLEAAGVDNWEGYDFAMELMMEGKQ